MLQPLYKELRKKTQEISISESKPIRKYNTTIVYNNHNHQKKRINKKYNHINKEKNQPRIKIDLSNLKTPQKSNKTIKDGKKTNLLEVTDTHFSVNLEI